MNSIDESKYIYGGTIVYKGKDIAILKDKDTNVKVFFEVVDGHYIELDEEMNNILDKVYNQDKDILYSVKISKKVVAIGLAVFIVTTYIGPVFGKSLSSKIESPSYYKQAVININAMQNADDNGISNDSGEGITAEDEEGIGAVYEGGDDVVQIQVPPQIQSNTNPITRKITRTSTASIDYENYLNHLKAHQYNSVDDILKAINTNPNLSEEEKKVFLGLEEFLRSDPYLDYNMVGYNLNTVKVKYIVDPSETLIAGTYNGSTNTITIYNGRKLALLHEARHCVVKNFKNSIEILDAKTLDTISTVPFVNDSQLHDFSKGIPVKNTETICGIENEFGLNEGMNALLDEEFNPENGHPYTVERQTVEILNELIGKEAMLKSLSTSDSTPVVDGLFKLNISERDIKSFIDTLDNYTITNIKLKDADTSKLLRNIVYKLTYFYKQAIVTSMHDDEYKLDVLSATKVMTELSELYGRISPEEVPTVTFQELYQWTGYQYASKGKDLGKEIIENTGVNPKDNNIYIFSRYYYNQNGYDFITTRNFDKDLNMYKLSTVLIPQINDIDSLTK